MHLGSLLQYVGVGGCEIEIYRSMLSFVSGLEQSIASFGDGATVRRASGFS